MIRDRALISPHTSYVRKMSLVVSIKGDIEECGHVAYLKDKAGLLQQYERHVILMLNEIHFNPKTFYEGGSLQGMAINSPDQEATTVQPFMICSLLSSNKDVAALIHVTLMNAEYLKECTVKAIDMLASYGYLVLCLISDNNRVNCNTFTDLCGGKLKPCIEHPRCSDGRLFFLYDSMHLLKSVP